MVFRFMAKGNSLFLKRLKPFVVNVQPRACGILRHIVPEDIAHVVEKRCPAGVCRNLLRYEIDPVKCRGCTLCARNCPVNAITGAVKAPHIIDQNKCIKCGLCQSNCRFDAVSKH